MSIPALRAFVEGLVGKEAKTYSINVGGPHNLNTETWQLEAIGGDGISLPSDACGPVLGVSGPVRSCSSSRPRLNSEPQNSRPLPGALVGRETQLLLSVL